MGRLLSILFMVLCFHAVHNSAAAETKPVKVFIIALEDDGKTGKKVGCGDSVVPLSREMSATSAPLEAAVTALLTLDKNLPGGEKMYNALAGSDLRLQRVEVKEGKTTVSLTGQIQLGGVCDNPRVEAQLRETVLQFPNITSAVITINGQPLEKVLSQK